MFMYLGREAPNLTDSWAWRIGWMTTQPCCTMSVRIEFSNYCRIFNPRSE